MPFNNKIRIKRHPVTATEKKAPTNLISGELAYDEKGEVLYIGVPELDNQKAPTGGYLSVEIGGKNAFVWKGDRDQTVEGLKTFDDVNGGVAIEVATALQGAVGDGTSGFAKRASNIKYVQDAISTRLANVTDLSITNGGPTAAVNKKYVDSKAQGLDIKASCRVATQDNVSLGSSGIDTIIDGIKLVENDRVLVKAQTDATENGIYKAVAKSPNGTELLRTADFNNAENITPGAFTFIEEGTKDGNHGYVLTTNAPITVGKTDLTFTKFSGAGQLEQGKGIKFDGDKIEIFPFVSEEGSNVDGPTPGKAGGIKFYSSGKDDRKVYVDVDEAGAQKKNYVLTQLSRSVTQRQALIGKEDQLYFVDVSTISADGNSGAYWDSVNFKDKGKDLVGTLKDINARVSIGVGANDTLDGASTSSMQKKGTSDIGYRYIEGVRPDNKEIKGADTVQVGYYLSSYNLVECTIDCGTY